MLEINKNNQTIELRNLQEQVQKNKEDIAKHYASERVLADFGIKVLGTLRYPSELPDPRFYAGIYGDAYAIGLEPPYSFYIFTRPDVNAGETENYWLNLGPLSVQGATGIPGPEGPEGPRGESGNGWRWGNTVPGVLVSDLVGNLYLDISTGNVYVLSNSRVWSIIGNIKGPQGNIGLQGPQGETGAPGPQGPKGDTGDVGGFINLYGILDNPAQLPTPESLKNLTIAYLVGSDHPYNLYIQIGANSSEAIWYDAGPLNVATMVYENGSFQNVWDADTKLTTSTPTSGIRLYASLSTGQLVYDLVNNGALIKDGNNITTIGISSTDLTENTLVKRTTNGIINVGEPVNNSNAATKLYVDNKLLSKQNTLTAGANISISGDTISATDTKYTAGTNVSISSTNVISARDTKYTAGENVNITNSNVISATDTKYYAGDNISLTTDSSGLQRFNATYSAGDNVNISNTGEISATDTKYTAGANVSISSNNVISATDTTYTAGDNITISNGVISATGGSPLYLHIVRFAQNTGTYAGFAVQVSIITKDSTPWTKSTAKAKLFAAVGNATVPCVGRRTNYYLITGMTTSQWSSYINFDTFGSVSDGYFKIGSTGTLIIDPNSDGNFIVSDTVTAL